METAMDIEFSEEAMNHEARIETEKYNRKRYDIAAMAWRKWAVLDSFMGYAAVRSNFKSWNEANEYRLSL